MKNKRILSFLLALCMALSLLPAAIPARAAAPMPYLKLRHPETVEAGEKFQITVASITSPVGSVVKPWADGNKSPIVIDLTPADGGSPTRVTIPDVPRGLPVSTTASLSKAGRYTITASADWDTVDDGIVTLYGHGEITVTGELGGATGELKCPASVAADQVFEIEFRNLKGPDGMYYVNSTIASPVELTATPAGGRLPGAAEPGGAPAGGPRPIPARPRRQLPAAGAVRPVRCRDLVFHL